jgi:hypothetical protein
LILAMKIDDSSRQAVLTRLKPHLPTLGQCFRAAWEHWTEWLKRPDGPPSGVTARSRASVLYDFIVAEAIRAFLGARTSRSRESAASWSCASKIASRSGSRSSAART